MEEIWYVDRAKLRHLLKEHAQYSLNQLAQAIGRSLSWVKKWKKRLQTAPEEDERVLWGLSRAVPAT